MQDLSFLNNSNSKPIILFQLDILKVNVQWINVSPGIWFVNFENDYPLVDDELLSGFSNQYTTFGDVGSIMIDSLLQIKVYDLLELANTEESFYYDDNNNLYVHVIDNDDPAIHNIFIGIINGFSYKDFTPLNSNTFYEGRIKEIPSIRKERDYLFFGKLKYSTGSVKLINSDGYFDSFAEDNNVYGNAARLFIGTEDMDISDYVQLSSLIVDTVSVREKIFNVNLKDSRTNLSKKILYSCTDTNALTAIEEILFNAYNFRVTSVYYDLTIWNASKLLAPNITIDISEEGDETEVIDLIENICNSCFGFFDISPEGKFTFKFIDTTATSQSVIFYKDFFNEKEITYDPSEILTSVVIGYDKNWTDNEYTYFTDDTREYDIFLKYKTYISKTFDTYINNDVAKATSLASKIMNYTEDVHGLIEADLPLSYAGLDIGDMVDIETNFSQTRKILSTKKAEVIGKNMNFNNRKINIKFRITE